MPLHVSSAKRLRPSDPPLSTTDNYKNTLEQIVESYDDAILVVGFDQQIHYTNPAAEELLGRDRDDIMDGPFGLPLVPAETTELNIVRPDGREIVAEMRAIEMAWLGSPAYVVSLRDITPRKQLENELRQAHKMEALGNLAGGIAHEFNNLLTAVLFNSGCLVEQLPVGDRSHRYATQIRSVANRAAALTGQLLTFSRKRHVQPALHDLNGIVTEMTTLLSQIIGNSIHLKTVCSSRPAMVLIDRGQFEQVIINLAVNARDAMPNGGTLEYEVEYVEAEAGQLDQDAAPEGYVSLTVRDTGCGMSDEVQARAFEPFFTTKDSQGTGLGLATTHGIIHQAGGRIMLNSQVGEGTVVRVMLPFRKRLETGLSQTAEETRRILVVDDDLDVREVMVDLLEHHGFEVQCASDGNQALQLLHRSEDHFDLVVTDMVMPGGGGARLADDIRQLMPQLPILFVSGHARDELPEHYRLDPSSEFVNKPFSTDEFIHTIERLLAVASRLMQPSSLSA